MFSDLMQTVWQKLRESGFQHFNSGEMETTKNSPKNPLHFSMPIRERQRGVENSGGGGGGKHAVNSA